MYFLFNLIFYSIFGYLFETGVCFALNKDYNSGFTFGPYTLVYGISLSIMFVLFRLINKVCKNNVAKYALFFILAFVVISGFEYGAGYLIEKSFGEVFWNYSEIPLTFGKYVNVFVSLFWSVGSILIFRFLLPQTDKIYKYIKPWMIIFMTSLILVDVFFSVISRL